MVGFKCIFIQLRKIKLNRNFKNETHNKTILKIR